MAQEIFKTPFRPLHLMLIEYLSSTKCGEVTPRSLYKCVSFWQRQIKAHKEYELSLEEKKNERWTKSLVARLAADEEAVAYLADAKLLHRDERMHLVPILCKYASSHEAIQMITRVQMSLEDDLVYCRV